MVTVISRLLAPVAVAAAVFAGPALAHQSSLRAGHHPAHHARRGKSTSCPTYNDGMALVIYSHVHATKLSCQTVQAVEKKLAPKLASGSGPRGPVVEVVGNVKFTCRAKLHAASFELKGSGSCTASNHRRFTFDAAHYAQ